VSAAGRSERGGEGRDFFPTPAWAVHRFLDAIPTDKFGTRWLEPCVGDGAIVRAVARWFKERDVWARPEWDGIDVHPRCEPDGPLLSAVEADFTWMDGAAWRGKTNYDRWHFCLTNPPYAQAMDFVKAALDHCDSVAMLLRLNWLASEERSVWLRGCPPAVYVLPNRPSFDGEGTDATDYAWMAWGERFEPRVHILRSTPAEARRAA
jgi:hypothetical protein